MNKNATLHTRKTAKRDPLKGAPGHLDAQAAAPQIVPNATSEKSTDTGTPRKNATNSDSTPVDGLIEKLGDYFGAESVDKWRALLKANGADARLNFTAFCVRASPHFPKSFRWRRSQNLPIGSLRRL